MYRDRVLSQNSINTRNVSKRTPWRRSGHSVGPILPLLSNWRRAHKVVRGSFVLLLPHQQAVYLYDNLQNNMFPSSGLLWLLVDRNAFKVEIVRDDFDHKVLSSINILIVAANSSIVCVHGCCC